MRKLITAFLYAALIVFAAPYAAAETDAQWKPNAFNTLAKCRPLWIALGDVPTDRNATGRDTTFVCHPRFALSHDNVSKTPDWVLEKLTRTQVSGSVNRPNKKFTSDKRVPPRGRAEDKDYPPKAVGLARGHMAPSEDFNNSVVAMKDTFVLSNAVPQVASFNGGIWGRFERRVRHIAVERKTVHVITGPVRRTGNAVSVTVPSENACGREISLKGPDIIQVCRAHNENRNVKCSRGVGVPIAVFKIVFDSAKDEVYAFVMPNNVHDRGGDDELTYLNKFRVPVATIEKMTGLQFFRQLPEQRQQKLLNACENNNLWAPEPKVKKKKKPA